MIFSDEKPVLNDKIPDRFSGKFIPERIEGLHEKNNEKPREKSPGERGLEEGIRLFHKNQWDDALKELLRVGTEGFSATEQVELAYYRGLCCAKLDREDAPIYLEQVVADGEDLLRVYQCRMALAYIYIKTGKVRMAEFELKRLKRAGFESVQLYNTMAYASHIQNRNREAVEFYEKALDLDRNNATAQNSLGYILADTEMNIKKGMQLCIRAVEQYPDNPAYLDSLGWAQYKSGEMPEARDLLKRAMKLAPQETEIKKHFMIVTGEDA